MSLPSVQPCIGSRLGSEPAAPTVSDLWPAADWHERETYDLLAVTFTDHPDLRRILMWDGYPYHPLRKDFLGLGEVTPGLARFPFENKESPDRLMNVGNLVRPDESERTAPQGQSVEPEGH